MLKIVSIACIVVTLSGISMFVRFPQSKNACNLTNKNLYVKLNLVKFFFIRLKLYWKINHSFFLRNTHV